MPDKSLRIALLQWDLHWHDPQANCAQAAELISRHQGPLDVVLLPEMFSTGFSMEAARGAEQMGGPSSQWMREIALQTNALVGGSLMLREGDAFVNRFLWVAPEGLLGHYDKRHLFALAGEDQVYRPGTQRLVVAWRGWNIATQICYDLRFPVWARNQFEADGSAAYDLLVNVANWPSPRGHHWDALLQARAIENLAYVAGVNRVGKDPQGFGYDGSSRVIAYDGEILASARKQSCLMFAELDAIALQSYRSRFPFWREADMFDLI